MRTQAQKPEPAPKELIDVALEVRRNLFPPPPQGVTVKLDRTATTFSSSYADMTIYIPPTWNSFKPEHLRAHMGHEHEHMSIDGLPSSFLEGKRIEARIMAELRVPNGKAHELENIIADAVIDSVLDSKGFAMRSAQEDWIVKNGKITPGSGFHILQMVYSETMGVKVPKTYMDGSIRSSPAFRTLVSDVYRLIKEQEACKVEKNIDLIVDAAKNLNSLIQSGSQEGACGSGRGQATPTSQGSAVAGIGIQAGLSADQIKDLLNNNDINADDAIADISKDMTRQLIWDSILPFNILEGSSSQMPIYQKLNKRWLGGDVSRLNPISVAQNRYEPTKWKKKYTSVFRYIKQENQSFGFKSFIAVIDVSTSTDTFFKDRSILYWETITAVRSLAYAKKNRIPASLIYFGSRAATTEKNSKDWVGVGSRAISTLAHISELRSKTGGNTVITSALNEVEKLTPAESFILIITDGSVSEAEQASTQIFSLAKQNRVVISLVTEDPSRSSLKEQIMKFNNKGVYMFAIRPEEAGKLVLQDLLKKQQQQAGLV
ncbi:MAG: VWA domain-containing protein [Nitrososphaerota archaeon]|nr:VWA domain-containing protein [Nitrososphaerota archaeon]